MDDDLEPEKPWRKIDIHLLNTGTKAGCIVHHDKENGGCALHETSNCSFPYCDILHNRLTTLNNES